MVCVYVKHVHALVSGMCMCSMCMRLFGLRMRLCVWYVHVHAFVRACMHKTIEHALWRERWACNTSIGSERITDSR